MLGWNKHFTMSDFCVFPLEDYFKSVFRGRKALKLSAQVLYIPKVAKLINEVTIVNSSTAYTFSYSRILLSRP
jgi:hypothetical protein